MFYEPLKNKVHYFIVFVKHHFILLVFDLFLFYAVCKIMPQKQ